MGGDGDIAKGLAPCFNRYHQTKLANTVFCVALHKKLAAAGSKVKSMVAEPGVATTDLAGNLQAGHKNVGRDVIPMMQGMLKHYPVMQSAADGSCPLMECAFGATANSGDFYAPKNQNSGVTMGMPVKVLDAGAVSAECPEWTKERFENEILTLHQANHDLLWSASEAACGETFSVASGEEGVPPLISPGKITIRYGAGPGRVEATRLALTIGGIDFDEEPIENWKSYKIETHHYRPKGQMPLLEVEGQGIFAQSHTQLRFAGKLAGLYPDDPFLAAKVDEALDYMVDGDAMSTKPGIVPR